jgi:hypothetical protein
MCEARCCARCSNGTRIMLTRLQPREKRHASKEAWRL